MYNLRCQNIKDQQSHFSGISNTFDEPKIVQNNALRPFFRLTGTFLTLAEFRNWRSVEFFQFIDFLLIGAI